MEWLIGSLVFAAYILLVLMRNSSSKPDLSMLPKQFVVLDLA